MKLSSEDGTVTVTFTRDEAYAIFNFTEYATRKGMKWGYKTDQWERFLAHGECEHADTDGLKETRKLAKKLGKVFGWN